MAIDKVNSAAAANVYKATQQAISNPSSGAGMEGDDSVSFGDMVKKLAGDTISSLRKGEQASASAITGKADITDVVQAVTQAELTLQTVVAMRDRLLGAYQEIMRMPI